MTEPTSPASPDIERRIRQDAIAATFQRMLLLGLLWGVTLPWRDGDSVGRMVLLNGVLAVVGWWAVQPGERDGGPHFGSRWRWTGFFLVPPLLFTMQAVLGLWELLRGTGS